MGPAGDAVAWRLCPSDEALLLGAFIGLNYTPLVDGVNTRREKLPQEKP
jgi:hypothetical protein